MPRAVRTTPRNRVRGALTTTVVAAVLGSAVLVPSSANAAPVAAALPPTGPGDVLPAAALALVLLVGGAGLRTGRSRDAG